MIKTINSNCKCEYDECQGKQEIVVFNRSTDTLMATCKYCADIIIEFTAPEYYECCPNCGIYWCDNILLG